MAKCPVLVQQKIDDKQGSSGSITGGPLRRVSYRPCGCNAKVLYRVDYSSLFLHRVKENKFSDLFGVCEKHVMEFSKVQAWFSPRNWKDQRQKTVNGLRGIVESVSQVEMSSDLIESIYRRDEIQKISAGFKSTIKIMMGRKNASKLRTEDWAILFEESIQEFIVEDIHSS